MVMFLMTYHYFDENIIVMINKYFYQEYFVDPDVNNPNREALILDMHETSMKFIAKYLMAGSLTGNVEAFDGRIGSRMFPFDALLCWCSTCITRWHT